MAKYYFNFADGERVYPDTEGLEVAECSFVSAEALKFGEALAKELEAADVDCSRWSVDVFDATGSLVVSIPFPGKASRAVTLWKLRMSP